MNINVTEYKKILNSIGQFSDLDIQLFKEFISYKSFKKNEILLEQGEICKSIYFVLSGSFYQYQMKDISEVIIDLHLSNEWIYNHQSLILQKPSNQTIKAFSASNILELSLNHFHVLVSASQSFLNFNKVLNLENNKSYIYDNSLTPKEKYEYIKSEKPNLIKEFPVKMIASFLKITPETLSRIRASK
ncbi:Crp/Fnr family transcriptional regulator [Flavobacterium sp. D11R37]|uniref:Crp/Fnr family transcriptional regulator n=1 Tax=Flavobacterium coralii TaxID=2838017 RepID=UPI001CA669CF|nr:Crp/Fnr family transcriptional regulator [Flavobacterium coralii]MBY8962841.1 Crp/Fnr family transcriptional regulator [Flavobacterium coralii]